MTSSSSPDTDIFDAARNGDLSRLEKCLAAGVDVDVRDEMGDTPLKYACDWGQLECVWLLLESGADANAKSTPEYGEESVLSDATSCSDACIAEIIALLVAAGADLEYRGSLNRTALIEAASHGNTAAVAELIRQGANVDAVADIDETALSFAIAWGYVETAKLVINAGVNVNWETSNGWTGLAEAVCEPSFVDIEHGSKREVARKEIVCLLLEKGADPDHIIDDESILLYAIRNSTEGIVIEILSKVTNIQFRDANGFTALRLAKERNMEQVARILKQHGVVE